MFNIFVVTFVIQVHLVTDVGVNDKALLMARQEGVRLGLRVTVFFQNIVTFTSFRIWSNKLVMSRQPLSEISML